MTGATCYDVFMPGMEGLLMTGSMRLNWGFRSSVLLLALAWFMGLDGSWI